MRTAISAISIYHIIDANTGNTIGQHPLVTTDKKAFWQLKPLIPRYYGTYDINVVLRFIENLGQNETLTLKQEEGAQVEGSRDYTEVLDVLLLPGGGPLAWIT